MVESQTQWNHGGIMVESWRWITLKTQFLWFHHDSTANLWFHQNHNNSTGGIVVELSWWNHQNCIRELGGPRGAEEKKEKRRTYLPTFFEIFLRFSGRIWENIFMVFLGSSCRETAKNAIKINRRERTSGFFFISTFLAKSFWHGFPQKVFYGVFELPLLRNAQKRH